MSGVRFTAYLSERERNDLRDQAQANGLSENVMLRLCLRAGLGLDVPEWARPILAAAPRDRVAG